MIVALAVWCILTWVVVVTTGIDEFGGLRRALDHPSQRGSAAPHWFLHP